MALSDPDWEKKCEMAAAGVGSIVEVLSDSALRKRLGITAEQERRFNQS